MTLKLASSFPGRLLPHTRWMTDLEGRGTLQTNELKNADVAFAMFALPP